MSAEAPGLDGLLPFAPLVLAMLGDDLASVKETFEGLLKRDPTDALVTTLVGGGIAFYLAEREHNPACKTPLDAILYLAMSDNTELPATETGKAIAAFVRTFSPNLAGEVIDKHSRDEKTAVDQAAQLNRAMLDRLDRIVALLERPT